MKKTLRRITYREGAREDRWRSYRGTGIVSCKDKAALVLRERLGGGKFAIIALRDGPNTNSPMKVLREVNSSDVNVAIKRFNAVAKQHGFPTEPV